MLAACLGLALAAGAAPAKAAEGTPSPGIETPAGMAGDAVGGKEASGAETTWISIRPDLFGQRAMDDARAFVTLDAPLRAEEAALVPIGVHIAMPPGDGRAVRAVTLVVDENPSPLVATFKLGEGRKDSTSRPASGSIPIPSSAPWWRPTMAGST